MDNANSQSSRDIHVWRLALQAEEHTVARFEKILLPDEIARADGFRFDYLRRRFIIARAALRVMLATYLRTDPDRVPLGYGPRGKPYVDNAAGICFNTSHSEELAMLAFASHCDLGIDIEHIRSCMDIIGIARSFFHEAEFAELVALPARKREQAFFSCWTRKEACIKASGIGLGAPFEKFQVTLLPCESAQLGCLSFSNGETSWMMHDLSDMPNYAAALVYQDVPRLVHIATVTDASELLEWKPSNA